MSSSTSFPFEIRDVQACLHDLNSMIEHVALLAFILAVVEIVPVWQAAWVFQ